MGIARAAVREPAVAGAFYPGDPEALRRMVRRLVPPGITQGPAIAVITPHAGYQYSGAVAGAVLARVQVPECVLILGPNHTGLGRPFSIMARGSWRTPLGTVPIDATLGATLMERCGVLEEDEEAHRQEHSIEVQLPLLQLAQPALRFVPIVVASTTLETYRCLGEGIAAAIRQADHPVLVIASTDFTHYEPHESARLKDAKALDAILALDESRLLQQLRRWEISMCGYAPTTAAVVAAKALGATRARLVEYRTSGDATGDYGSVVGYAGVILG